ncbi:MAG: SPOR protein [Actinobacteria bacterium]|nr:SPOR protein [Actinomycetota bacterium]MBM2827640.1 hypothetical protein [Actinomycetota bacterium]
MKYLYNKRNHRRGDGERHSFAFFAVGAIVLLAAAFVIGLQVGRVVEKNAAGPEGRTGRNGETRAGSAEQKQPAAADARKDLGSYSEEAGKVPVVPPPDAKDTAADVEKRLTFQESLPRKEAGPVALVRRAQNDNASGLKVPDEGRKRYMVQAATFREKGKAESFRKRLADAGFAAPRMLKGTGKNREKYYRVILGPFADRESARKAVLRLKEEMKVDSYLLPAKTG